MMDPRRAHLDRMIRKYAYNNHIPFGVAWREFENELRSRGHVNIEAEVTKLRREHRIPPRKRLSMPDALELTGHLDNAIKVADRMLGPQQKARHGH